MSTTATNGHYRRAGSGRSGPAERKRRAQRVFAAVAVCALAASGIYAGSVGNDQPDASAANGVLGAVDDSVDTLMETPVTVDVGANDTGEGDISTYAVVHAPANGVLSDFDIKTATIKYVPNRGFVGMDKFAYSVDELPGTYFDVAALTTGAKSPSQWTTSATLGGRGMVADTPEKPGATWATDPFEVGGWLCDSGCPRTDDVFFTRSFQIVDKDTAASLALALDVYAADYLVDVYVNDVALGISNKSDTSCDGCAMPVVLAASNPSIEWAVGINTITFHVATSDADAMGLMVTPSKNDTDLDGVGDFEDRCLSTPKGATVNDMGCRRETATVLVEVLDPKYLPGAICGQPVNGSFEDPLLEKEWKGFNHDDVPGWSATTKVIEIWRSPFQGSTAVDGAQIAELNSTGWSTLYQDIATTPGETITWSFTHRGRDGIDVMNFLAGPPKSTGAPDLALQAVASTDTKWQLYSGTYVVPNGQTTTRFAFENVSSSDGRSSYGNLIDDFRFVKRCSGTTTTTTTTSPSTTTTSTTTTSTTVPASTSTSTTTSTTTTSTTVPASTTTTVPASTTTSTSTSSTSTSTTTTSTTTTTVAPTTTTTVAPTSTTTVAPTSTTTVAPTSTTTVAPTSTTTVAPTTTAGETTTTISLGDPVDQVDTDGDGVLDADDPTPVMDVTIEFDTVERTTTSTEDSLHYELSIGNNGPDDAASSVISVTPPDGVLITDWTFGSWMSDAPESVEAAGLFGLVATTDPVCWLDAFILRCEVGTVPADWSNTLAVEMDVYETTSSLEANASIVALGFDTDLDNNHDRIAVASKVSFFNAVPDALAFTGLHLGLMWWFVIALALIGGGVVLKDAGRRRSETA